MINKTTALAERDREVLQALTCASGGTQWVRPLDIGGCDGSDESYRLAKLVRLGLAEKQRRSVTYGRRGSWEYRSKADA